MHVALRATGTGALLLALLAVLLVPAGPRAEAAPSVRVVASDTTSGHDASALLHPSAARRAIWRSPKTVGATLTTRFAARTSIDGSRIRGAAASMRVVDARLEFSDGSTLAVHTDARGDRTVRFPARTVRWVRLVVAGVAHGQKSVGLAGWTLQKGRSSKVSTSSAFLASPTVSASSGQHRGTRWKAAVRGGGQWLKLRWNRPVEVSAVRLAGGSRSAATGIRTGSLRFSDGSSVLVRSLEPSGGAPTTIAFTPRVVSSVRFVAESVNGHATAAVRSVRAYPVGVVPAAPKTGAKTYTGAWATAKGCGGIRSSAPAQRLRLLCPTNGTRTGRTVQLVVAGPAGATVTVRGWRPRGTGGSVAVVGTARADARGTARLTVSTRALLHGPAALMLTAPDVAAPLYVQFDNASGVVQKTVTSPITHGMDLKFSDTFSGRLSATRTGAGATYASGKPNSYGVDDFGAAIFAQPDGSSSTSSTMPGGYLRIPARALPASKTDPAGYGRRATGGLLSSAHMGGSGFSAQYGYFEIRMLAPAGRGTWPAFWLLSSGSLVGGGGTGEIDAVELYGAAPRKAFQTVHNWAKGADPLGRSMIFTPRGSGDSALSWHTYGARVTPTGVDFFIDGVRTAHTGRIVGQAEPFFFLIDLALEKEWPTGLAGTGHRADLYVDWVRVWV